MFERFTNRARETLALAQEQAGRLGQNFLGTEHVLLALALDADATPAKILTRFGVTPDRLVEEMANHVPVRGGLGRNDAEVLQAIGIDLDEVRRKVEEAFGPGALERTGVRAKGAVPFTPKAKKALEFSLREALTLKHNWIGPEHLLLGLLREESLAGKLLQALGADPDDVRAAVRDELRRAS